MRGKLTNQDLTDYALNEGLEDRGRRYVESVLAVSEECRNDVCQMMDMAQLLEQGFERDYSHVDAQLTVAQRAALLNPPRSHPATVLFCSAAAATALAACLAVVIIHPDFWQGRASEQAVRNVATVSDRMKAMVTSAVDASDSRAETDFASLVDLHTMVDDSSAWLRTAADSATPQTTVCTPPSLAKRTDFVPRR